MRTREEIEEEITESGAMNNGAETIRLLLLETALDIRDLLLASERRTEQFTEELQRLRK